MPTSDVHHDIRKLTNSYSVYLPVDNNYKITDGYPMNNCVKGVKMG